MSVTICEGKIGQRLHTDFNQNPARMLASKATTAARTAARRSFATVADASGVKVAAIDNGQPTSAVTFLVKGGSRFETKPGVAQALKNFAFKVSR
jgi:ubiquinol-cytochrome c reductase core subunit 2